MIETSCLCGRLRIATERPEFVNECNCTLCRKTGARWGYFHPDAVTVTGASTAFTRSDKRAPNARIHFCPTCGSTTHFRLTQAAVARFGDTLMGVNLRLADEAALAGVELRFPDGARWDGAGAFGFVREAVVIGQ